MTDHSQNPHGQRLRAARTAVRRLVGVLAATLLALTAIAQAPDVPAAESAAADAQASSASPTVVPAGRQASNVAVITIQEPIDSVTARSVARRIALAEQAGAEAIVFDIDTPGGEVGAVLEISGAIKGTTVPNTVAWINDTAYSGGAIIAFACREIVAADPSKMGDALVVSPLMALPEAERQKVTVTLIAEMVNSARLRGWDEYLLQAVVSRFIELWYVEHLETGERLCIDEAEYRMLFDSDPPRGSARLASASPNPNAPEAPASFGADDAPPTELAEDAEAYQSPGGLLNADETARVRNDLEQTSQRPLLSEADRGQYQLLAYVCDGNAAVVFQKAGPADDMAYFDLLSSTVNNDEELKGFFGAENLTRLDPSWSEAVVRFLMQFWVRGLLIVIFIVGLFLEMSAPGTSLPGIAAAIALGMLLAPPYLAGMAGWWEIVAILIGVGCLLVEIFVLPGFGLFGVAGILALFIGLLGTFVPDQSGGLFPNSPKAERDALWGAATILMAFVTAGGGVFLIARKSGSLPFLNRFVLSNPEPGEDESPLAVLRPTEETVRVGDEGVADTDLRPSGRAEISGQLIDVVSGLGYIGEGARVRVSSVESLRVVVDEIGADPNEGETNT